MLIKKLLQKELLVLLLILILSSFKYFYQALVINSFDFDHEFLALEAWKIVKDHRFTLIGAPTSVGGLFIGPLYTYLVALVMVITRFHPYSINFLSAFWATLTPLAIYFVSRKMFSRPVGIIAALFAAVSLSYLSLLSTPPLVIPIGLVSLLAFWSLSQISSQPRLLYLYALLAGVAINLHFTGIYLLPMLLVWLLFKKPKLKIKDIGVSLGIFGLFISPLLLFELRHQFFLFNNLVTFLRESSSLNQSFTDSLRFSGELFLVSNGQLINNLTGNNLLMGLLAAGAFLVILFKSKITDKYQLLLFWLAMPFVFNSLYAGNILPYYFIIQQAQFFILVGLIIAKILPFPIAWAFLALIVSSYASSAFHSLSGSHRGFQLQNKMAAFAYVKNNAGTTDVNLSFTVLHAQRGGLEFLRLYYGFDDQLEANRQTYTIVVPQNFESISSDVKFGEIGLILP